MIVCTVRIPNSPEWPAKIGDITAAVVAAGGKVLVEGVDDAQLRPWSGPISGNTPAARPPGDMTGLDLPDDGRATEQMTPPGGMRRNG